MRYLIFVVFAAMLFPLLMTAQQRADMTNTWGKEQESLRTANSRTFVDDEGRYHTQLTGGYFHYKNDKDQWVPIQTAISASLSDRDVQGIFATDLPLSVNTANGLTEMTLEKKGHAIRYGSKPSIEMWDSHFNVLSAIEKNAVFIPEIKENTVRLNQLFDKVDRVQELHYWQLQTDYILHSKPQFPNGSAFMVFSDEMVLPAGWDIHYFQGENTDEGWRGSLSIVNEAGLQVATVSSAKFYDSFFSRKNDKNEKEVHAMVGTYQLDKTSLGYRVKLLVPVAWLNRDELVYPVIIDPTISNTYTGTYGVMDHFTQFTSSCQAVLNLALPPGPNYIVTNTSTQYDVYAQGTIAVDGLTTYYAAGFEQHTRVGFGTSWSSAQTGYGNSESPQIVSYSLPNLLIANGCYPGGTVLPFFWQGYQEYFPPLQGPPSVNVYGCVQNYHYLIANSWIVTVTYDVAQVNVFASPPSKIICSGESIGIALTTSPSGSSINWTVSSTGVSGATAGAGNNLNQILTATGNTAGIATYTVTPNYMGCPGDPETIEVTVNPVFSSTINAAICPGEVYSFNGTDYDQSGVYQAFLHTAGGCDSTITLNLSVNTTINHALTQNICQGESYWFNGTALTEQGEYEATFQSVGGCDSIVALTLNVFPIYNESISETICQGNTYSFGGSVYQSTGVYEHTFQSVSGCDSLVTLHLTVTEPPFTSFNETICGGESYPFGGESYTESGDYTAVFSTVAGCDSLVTLHLNVIPIITHSFAMTICEGETYFFNGNAYTTDGTYTATFQAATGCKQESVSCIGMFRFITFTVNCTVTIESHPVAA